MTFKTNNGLAVPTLGEMADGAIKGGHEWSQTTETGEAGDADVVTAPQGGGDAGEVASAQGGGQADNKEGNEGYDPYKGELEAIGSQINYIDRWMESAKEPESKEDREKRERREKSRRVISAVSDGLSALGNLFFTTRYAPDMYEPKNSLATATNAQIERARAEREKNDEAYYNFALKRGQLERERAKTQREIEAELERQAIAAQKAQDDHDRATAWINLYGQKQDTEEKRGDKVEAETGYIVGAKTEEAKSRTEKNNAQTENIKSGRPMNGGSSTRSKSGGGGKGGHDEVTVVEEYDKNGNLKKTKKTTKNNGRGTTKGKSWSLKD